MSKIKKGTKLAYLQRYHWFGWRDWKKPWRHSRQPKLERVW